MHILFDLWRQPKLSFEKNTYVVCSLIKITCDSFVLIIWINLFYVEDFSNVHSRAFVISCYHFPHSFLWLCLQWQYIFFVLKRSVKYANFGQIWLNVVVNDCLVFTFQKLIHSCNLMSQGIYPKKKNGRHFKRKKILDASGPVECLFSKHMFFYIRM